MEYAEAVQLFAAGRVVEWSAREGMRTGTVDTSERPRGDKAREHHSSHLYSLRAPPDQETLAVAQQIIGAAEVPAAVRRLFSGP